MQGKLFQLLDSSNDGEQVGLIYCENEKIDEDIVGYHWAMFCEENDTDVDEFSDYVSEKTNEVFVRVFVEEIFN